MRATTPTRASAPWTQIFDHYFFDSCYSMSPGGRMEICTSGPGFQLDEKLEDLGDRSVSRREWSRFAPSSSAS